jgi:hypothetical protein
MDDKREKERKRGRERKRKRERGRERKRERKKGRKDSDVIFLTAACKFSVIEIISTNNI